MWCGEAYTRKGRTATASPAAFPSSFVSSVSELSPLVRLVLSQKGVEGEEGNGGGNHRSSCYVDVQKRSFFEDGRGWLASTSFKDLGFPRTKSWVIIANRRVALATPPSPEL